MDSRIKAQGSVVRGSSECSDWPGMALPQFTQVPEPSSTVFILIAPGGTATR